MKNNRSNDSDVLELLAEREAILRIESESCYGVLRNQWVAALTDHQDDLLDRYDAAVDRHIALILARLANGVH